MKRKLSKSNVSSHKINSFHEIQYWFSAYELRYPRICMHSVEIIRLWSTRMLKCILEAPSISSTVHVCRLGLPTIPYFPGRPVFRPLCPASRLESSRDARCPVFWPLHSCCFKYVYSYWIYDRSSWSPVALKVACTCLTSESHGWLLACNL